MFQRQEKPSVTFQTHITKHCVQHTHKRTKKTIDENLFYLQMFLTLLSVQCFLFQHKNQTSAIEADGFQQIWTDI